MDISTQFVLEAIGWIGSILIVWSLMQARVLRFRWMNFAGAFIATFYNAIIGVWPFAFMNAAITIIDAYWLIRLYREQHDDAAYTVIPLEPEDPYLQHVLAVHQDDIAKHQPAFTAHALDDGDVRSTFLVALGDEAVGVVAVKHQGNGVGTVELDWVKERFRDFAPGEFVYRASHALTDAGFTRLEILKHDALDPVYLGKVGFKPQDDRWVRESRRLMAACPCGSAAAFADCCRPFLRGDASPPTAEALMRSRYTAHVRRDQPYLLRTWHPATRPVSLDLNDSTWLGLEILATSKGKAADASGTVTFVAHYAGNGIEPGTMRELSRFERDARGHWQYVDGDVS